MSKIIKVNIIFGEFNIVATLKITHIKNKRFSLSLYYIGTLPRFITVKTFFFGIIHAFTIYVY